MSKIILHTIEDVLAHLPKVLAYAPQEGAIIVADSQFQPVAALTPDVLFDLDARDVLGGGADADLASDLRVFAGRKVLLFRIGHHAPLALVSRALKIAGVTEILLTHSIAPAAAADLFADLGTRDEYVAAGIKDSAQRRADEVVALREMLEA